MSLLLLFGGEEAATPVESTVGIAVAFTVSAAADVAAVKESTVAVPIAFGNAIPTTLMYKSPPVTIPIAFETVVPAWTRTRSPLVSIPLTLSIGITPNPYVSDTIDLEVVWSSLRNELNDGLWYCNLLTMPHEIRGRSTAADNLYPSYYRTRIDGGSWGSWTAYVPNNGKRLQPMTTTITFTTYGDHYVDVEMKDDDNNEWPLYPDYRAYITIIDPAVSPQSEGNYDVIPTRIVTKASRRGYDVIPVRIITSAGKRR